MTSLDDETDRADLTDIYNRQSCTDHMNRDAWLYSQRSHGNRTSHCT